MRRKSYEMHQDKKGPTAGHQTLHIRLCTIFCRWMPQHKLGRLASIWSAWILPVSCAKFVKMLVLIQIRRLTQSLRASGCCALYRWLIQKLASPIKTRPNGDPRPLMFQDFLLMSNHTPDLNCLFDIQVIAVRRMNCIWICNLYITYIVEGNIQHWFEEIIQSLQPLAQVGLSPSCTTVMSRI